jgi:16S rRNA (uracil1498-N3)-methyltransferase
MSAPRFFVDRPLPHTPTGRDFELPEAAARHVALALRMRPGDALALFDGTGGEFAATITRIDKRGVTASIDRFDPVERESPHRVTLVQAVIANDPMDWAVRKAVELGVAAVQPVLAARSQGSARGEKSERRLAHWRGIAIAACEQCGRNRVPGVLAPMTLADWLAGATTTTAAAEVATAGPVLMLAPGAARSLAIACAAGAPSAVIVGPEGGFTDDELALADRCGVERVALGPRVLRAETAAVAALAIVDALVAATSTS